jgi:hypothetical protein
VTQALKRKWGIPLGAHVTRFTSTQVQILTQKALLGAVVYGCLQTLFKIMPRMDAVLKVCDACVTGTQVLALLVQKYKY